MVVAPGNGMASGGGVNWAARQQAVLEKVGRFLAQILTAIMTLFVVGAVTAIVLLARGPIGLDTAKPYVEAALNDIEAPVRIGIGETMLAWEPTRLRLEVRVMDLRITGAEQRMIATAPAMTVDLDPFALVAGRVEPERVILLAPNVRLVRNIDGGIELGLGGGAGDDVVDLVESWLAGDIPAATRSLARISIVDADLVIDDQLTGQRWHAARSTLGLTRGAAGLSVELAARIEVDGRPATLNVNALYRDALRPISIDFAFTGMTPAFLAREFAVNDLGPLAALEVPLSGRVTTQLAADMSLIDAKFELNATGGRFDLPEQYSEPLDIDRVHAQGRIENLGERIVVEKLDVSFAENLQAAFAGTMRRAETGLAITGEVGFSTFARKELLRFWPRGVAPAARSWVAERVRAGTVRQGRISLDITPDIFSSGELSASSLVLGFNAADVRVAYLSGYPEVRDARGIGRIHADKFEIDIEGGRMGGIDLSEGKVIIDLAKSDDEPAEIAFRARAPTSVAFDLLSREPIDLERRFGIQGEGVRGDVDAVVALVVPLEEEAGIDDMKLRALVNLEDVGMDDAFEGLAITKGRMQLQVGEEGLDGKGQVVLNGVPVNVNWRHDFADDSEFPSRYGLGAILDDGARKALSLPLADVLRGPVSAELRLSRHRSGRYEGAAGINLKEGEVDLAAIHWKKPAGEEASTKFSFVHEPDGRWRVTDFNFEGGGGFFAGEGEGTASSTTLRVRRARFAENDVTADIAIALDGATTVALSGRAFDLRPMLDALDGPTLATSLDIEAKLLRLVVSDRQTLNDATVKARRVGGDWPEMTMTGLLNGQAPIDLKVSPSGGAHRRVQVESADAGAALAALGYLSSVVGGRLKIDALIPKQRSAVGLMLEGRVRVDDFVLAQASVLSQALAADSVEGVRKLVRDNSILFDRFTAPFQMSPSRIVLPEGQAKGPSVVLTISGFVDRDRDLIDFKGAIAPAHGINTALGKIPVLGNIFVGREGEGIFAMSYKVKGSAESPTIRMNPLTALAPGFLRRIVEALGEPEASGTPGNPEYPVGGQN